MKWLALVSGLLVAAVADVAWADCRSGCSVCPRESGAVVVVDAEIVRRDGGTVQAIAIRSWGPAAEHVAPGSAIVFEIYDMGDQFSAAQTGNRVFAAAGWPDEPLAQPVWRALPFDAERQWVDCYSFPEGGLALDEAIEFALAENCTAAEVDVGWDTSCTDTISACSTSGGDATWFAVVGLVAALARNRRGVVR